MVRTTKALRVYFLTDNDLKNFNATFRKFLEIPIDLIQKEVRNVSNEFPERPSNFEISNDINHNLINQRNQKEVLCGWASQVMHAYEDKSLQKFINQHLSNLVPDPESKELTDNLAISALRAAQGPSGFADETIWQVSVNFIFSKIQNKGFGKADLLKEIEKELITISEGHAIDTDSEEIKKWLNFAKQIFNSER